MKMFTVMAGIIVVIVVVIIPMCVSHHKGPLHTRTRATVVRTVHVRTGTVTTVTRTTTRIRH